MTIDTFNAYGTNAEKAFLDQLASGPTAVTLLSNYITAAERRTVWGLINKAEVVEYARILLGNAQARRAAQLLAGAA